MKFLLTTTLMLLVIREIFAQPVRPPINTPTKGGKPGFGTYEITTTTPKPTATHPRSNKSYPYKDYGIWSFTWWQLILLGLFGIFICIQLVAIPIGMCVFKDEFMQYGGYVCPCCPWCK